MTPALILTSLEDALKPLVAAEKGILDVSETPNDTLALLCKSPNKWRCILQWAGHDGDEDTHGTSKTGSVAVIIQAAKGLQLDRGADAHRSRGDDARPILELVSLVNNWIRGILFTDEEGELLTDVQTYKGKSHRQVFVEGSGDWLEIEGVEIRQYRTTHTLRYADRQVDDEARSVVIAIETPVANIVRLEIAGDGERTAFSDPAIRRVYLAFLNGQAIGDDASLAGPTVTFTTPPQPGDTVMLLGAS